MGILIIVAFAEVNYVNEMERISRGNSQEFLMKATPVIAINVTAMIILMTKDYISKHKKQSSKNI